LKEHAGSRTILGSGDLFNAQACLDMMQYTGVDGVTGLVKYKYSAKLRISHSIISKPSCDPRLPFI
jgi:hypothetical protein